MTSHPNTPRTDFSPREAIVLWLRALQLRPLLWLMPCVVSACLAGAWWTHFIGATTRADWGLACPALFGALALSLAWRVRHTIWTNRVWLGIGVFGLMTSVAAWRWTPPTHDISFVAQQTMARDAPLRAVPVTIRGRIVGAIERDDFQTQWALQVLAATPQSVGDSSREKRELQSIEAWPQIVRGTVWVRAPRGVRVNAGDLVETRGALRLWTFAGHSSERDRARRLVARDCWCWLETEKVNDLRVIGRDENGFGARLERVRRAIFERYLRAFGADENHLGAVRFVYGRATAQLLTAMTFGEGGLVEPLPRSVRERFRAAGLSHILVASGTQVSVLAALCLGVLQVFGGANPARRAWGALLVALPIVGYALLAGGAASIWRAALGGIVVAWAVGSGRRSDAMSLWCGALIALLLIDARQIFDLSLQLSFGAVWGLIALTPVFENGLKRVPILKSRRWLRTLTAASLGAQCATWPIVLFHFGRLSVAGIGANLPGVPLAGVLVISGGLGLVFPFLNGFNYHLTRTIDEIAAHAARWPGAQIEAPPLRVVWMLWLVLALVMLAVAGAWPRLLHQARGKEAAPVATTRSELWRQTGIAIRDEWENWRKRQPKRTPGRLQVLAGVVLVAMFFAWRWWPREAIWRVSVLDVGQGEAIVIQAPDGRAVLIDGGSSDANRPDVGRHVIVPYLQSRGIERLEALVITHADSDHFSGLESVAREIPIARVWLSEAPPTPLPSDEYGRLLSALGSRGAQVQVLAQGDKVQIGALGANVLWPPRKVKTTRLETTSDNNRSLVLQWQFGQSSALFTADIEAAAENALLQNGDLRPVTLLKVAHHGSKTGSQARFLKAVAPQAALISCGRYNRFGHPHATVLERLTRNGAEVLRTDLDGTIEAQCDARGCEIRSFR